MAVLGPIKLNGGWVSDGDIWNPTSPGGTTYLGLMPWLGGAKTLDGQGTVSAQITGAPGVIGLFYWQDPAQEGNTGVNGDIVIAFTDNSKCYTSGSSNDYLTAWTDRTAAVTLPSTGFYTTDSLNGLVISANGSANTGPWKIAAYNGNIALLSGSPPAGSIVKTVNNFLFLSGVYGSATTMSRVYWSNVIDPETWGAANFVEFRKSDGDVVTALESIGSDLIVFKTNSIARLSTSTIEISGSVTLGPLTEISSTIGCVGPLAVDKMPDGSLVFLSTNGHVYQTDGIVFKDLSHNPYPASNVRTQFPNRVISDGVLIDPLYFAQLKVDGSMHRIYLMPTPYTGSQIPVYIFDYEPDAWADWTPAFDATNFPKYMNAIPSRDSLNKFGAPNRYVFFGLDTGYVLSLNSPTGFLQKLSGAATTVCTYETSVDLGGVGPPKFIPRGLILPVQQAASGAGTLTVRIGFDGTYKSSDEYSSAMGNTRRHLIPISENLTSRTFTHPATIQIKITLTGNTTLDQVILGPFYLTDEVPT